MNLTPIPLLLMLAGCTGFPQGADGFAFDIRLIDVGFEPGFVLARDVDRDGSLDVLVSGDDSILVLRGDGTGELTPTEKLPAGENPWGLASGDLDEDGWLDLVVANHETAYLALLFGGPDGFRKERTTRLEVSVDPHPHAVVVADIDGDGHLDVLVDDRNRHRLGVLLGRGDGSFVPAEPIAVGGDPYLGMAVGDLDGDGDLDVVTPDPATVNVLHGDGAGLFSPVAELSPPALHPFTVAIGDVNGDGIQDLGAGSGEEEGAFAVWLGSADGAYTLDPESPYRLARGPTVAWPGDVDGDGITDFVVTSYVGDELAILLGGRQGRRLVRIEVEDSPWGVATGDLDGDGRAEIVTAKNAGTEIAVLRARPVPRD